ncbi:MAG: undecaprenyldiphospho-muramoylpentapeptide beta-N-acetylglucosaminyltransferase, partial [Mucinivorans sp.]
MKIIVSGGGTAGHIYPALAVADCLRTAGHDILFVGSQGKMEMERVPMNGYPITGLPVVGIKRDMSFKSLCSNLTFPFRLWRSLTIASSIIKREKPDVVVGFGGYASAPIVRAAQKRHIPTVIQEQNSFAGLTNRVLSRHAKKICTAYENMDRFFPADKIVITGNPLRSNMDTLPTREQAIEALGLDSAKRTILVTGGSLGTRTLNDMVFSSMEHKSLPDGVQVIWQTGKYYITEYENKIQNLIRDSDFSIVGYKVVPFIERMDQAYAAADVVICRAGASTVSELQLVGCPTIFVPSPVVAEDHQTMNARALVGAEAALMVTDNDAVEQGLAQAIALIDNEKLRATKRRNMRAMARPEAAYDVSQIIIDTIRQSKDR